MRETRWDSPVNVEKRDYLQVEKDAWSARRRVGDIPVTIISNKYSADQIAVQSSPRSVAGCAPTCRTSGAGWSSARKPGSGWCTPGHAVEEEDPTLVTDAILGVVRAARAAENR